jgi:hypothetical protein
MNYKHSLHCTSVAVQTLPPTETETVHPACHPSPTVPARTRPYQRRGVTNAVEDLQARVDLLSDAIDGFKQETRSIKHTLEARRKPANAKSDPPSASPPSTSTRVGVPPAPRSPPQQQSPPEPPSLPPSPNKSQPDFQRILRVEDECIR